MALYSSEDVSRPGPRPGSAEAGAAPSSPGVRQGTQGRPRGSGGSGVVAPPGMGTVAPPGGASMTMPSYASGLQSGMPGMGGSGGPGAPQPGQPGQPEQPGAASPMAPRIPQPFEMDMMPPGAAMETPIGTFTQTPQGPMVALNEAGMMAYQRRMTQFYEAYRNGLPPELRDDASLPLPQVRIGQQFFHPWTQQWMKV